MEKFVGQVSLPKKIASWSRADSPQVVTTKTIFDYMDGAGELYIGYRFHHLEVYNYTSPSQDEILAELYWMESSDDAFGLLSQDWGGEAVNLDGIAAETGVSTGVPFPRALYGAGLLRIWSGNLYARVMAYQETDASKQAVFELGRDIVSGRPKPRPPQFLSVFKDALSSSWHLKTERLCYFKSHLVLNSIYFLSNENLVNLSLSCEAIHAAFEPASGKEKVSQIHLLLIRYSNPEEAHHAQEHFEKIYLPEKRISTASRAADTHCYPIEDGWMGYRQKGRNLVLVFECPDRETAVDLIDSSIRNLESLEVSHD